MRRITVALSERGKFVYGRNTVLCPENGTSGHQHIGACGGTKRAGLSVDTAVDFYQRIQAKALDKALQFFDFMDCMWYEFLSAEARINAHEEDHVKVLDYVLKEHNRRRRIERDSSLHARGVYLLDCTVQMRAGLVVDVHQRGTTVAYLSDIFFWIYYHQVHIHGLTGRCMDGFQHWKTKRNIRNENAVHDIAVDTCRFAGVNHGDVVGKVTEVGRKE